MPVHLISASLRFFWQPQVQSLVHENIKNDWCGTTDKPEQELRGYKERLIWKGTKHPCGPDKNLTLSIARRCDFIAEDFFIICKCVTLQDAGNDSSRVGLWDHELPSSRGQTEVGIRVQNMAEHLSLQSQLASDDLQTMGVARQRGIHLACRNWRTQWCHCENIQDKRWQQWYYPRR